MLTVMCCYTTTSLSDKYAVADAKFSGDEFTFLMFVNVCILSDKPAVSGNLFSFFMAGPYGSFPYFGM